jgi:hypothetical protein
VQHKPAILPKKRLRLSRAGKPEGVEVRLLPSGAFAVTLKVGRIRGVSAVSP